MNGGRRHGGRSAAGVRAALFVAALGWVGCERSTSVGLAGGPFDAAAADDAGRADASSSGTPAELCLATGGAVTTQTCCSGQASFPDSCAIGACGCGPASSVPITICSCNTGCYLAGIGCVGQSGICTPGVDSSCDRDPGLATPRGRCVTGSRCVCVPGATLSSAGKCF